MVKKRLSGAKIADDQHAGSRRAGGRGVPLRFREARVSKIVNF
jgi:hypothetical protein